MTRIGRSFRLAAFLSAAFLLHPALSFASNKVSSPDVTRGLMELEYRGGYDFDDSANKDKQQVHKFVVNYGLTDRWRLEAKANRTGTSSTMEWTYAETSVRYQILEDEEGWFRLALQENFKVALTGNSPNKLEQTILAARDMGFFTHVFNINFENELGANAKGGTDLNLAWKSKYRYDPYYEPGIEAYAGFGKFGSPSSETPDKYQLGPALSGKMVGALKYDLGYLFGLNENAPDGRLKLILTYAFPL